MGEIAKEELLSRIRALSEEEKVLVAQEISSNILIEVIEMRIQTLEELKDAVIDINHRLFGL